MVYYRLPFERARHWARGEDRAGLAEQAHYHAWQIGAGWLARRLHRERSFDVVHHVSFMRYWSPSAARTVDAPFLWGPVGGGESAPRAFYPALSRRGRRAERMRDLARAVSVRLPSVRRTARRATLALAATPESAAALRRTGAQNVETAPASVALGADALRPLGALPGPCPGPVRFVAVGRLLAWKGTALGLRAFARAQGAPGMDGAEFWVVGDGPERGRLERLAEALGVGRRVRFLGRVPRDEALRLLGRAHALVHPSLHDSGGYAVLEALAAGRPVVCLGLGGPGQIVTPEAGVVVPARTPEQAEADLAAALRLLASNPDLRARMGAAGRARVAERFTWEAVLRDTRAHYARLAGAADAPPEPAGGRRQPRAAHKSPPPGQGESPKGEGVDRASTDACSEHRAPPGWRCASAPCTHPASNEPSCSSRSTTPSPSCPGGGLACPAARAMNLTYAPGGAVYTAATSTRGRWAGDRYLLGLGLLLAAYAVLGRPAAYVGVPPLFVGEVVLVWGAVTAARFGRWGPVLGQPAAGLLLALMGAHRRADGPVPRHARARRRPRRDAGRVRCVRARRGRARRGPARAAGGGGQAVRAVRGRARVRAVGALPRRQAGRRRAPRPPVGPGRRRGRGQGRRRARPPLRRRRVLVDGARAAGRRSSSGSSSSTWAS